MNATRTGLDLKAERVRRGLRQADLAQLLGVSRRRVATIEGQHKVPPALANRYFGALNQTESESHGHSLRRIDVS